MILDYPLTACLQQVGVGLYQKNNQFLIHFWMKMKSFRDYLGLSNSCSYDVDDVIGRADRFGFQNFCSPAINSDWIGDIQTVFSALPLMLQKLFSWENVPLKTQKKTCYRLATQCLLRRNGKLSQPRKYLYSPNCINVHILQRKVIIQNLF